MAQRYIDIKNGQKFKQQEVQQEQFDFTDDLIAQSLQNKIGKYNLISEIIPTFEDGGEIDPPIKSERYANIKARDNTYVAPRRVDIRELQNEIKDKQEYTSTGTVKNPRSIAYKKLKEGVKTQPMLSQDNRSAIERVRVETAANKAATASLGLERPLVYLSNPAKLLGDAANTLAPDNKLGLPTSEEDRLKIMQNRYAPYQSSNDRISNTLQQGLGYIPSASANVALGIAGAGENLTIGNVLNEVLNPIAGAIERPIANYLNNVSDLKYFNEFAKNYGYETANPYLRGLSGSTTDDLVKNTMNQHNTFVRGVSTNWKDVGQDNPQVLEALNNAGIDYVNNPKAAAEYMATHVPPQIKGYGRMGLNDEVNGVYMSNSSATAQGYTYGDGFEVTVQRPVNFDGNRQNWIDSNNPITYENANIIKPNIAATTDIFKTAYNIPKQIENKGYIAENYLKDKYNIVQGNYGQKIGVNEQNSLALIESVSGKKGLLDKYNSLIKANTVIPKLESQLKNAATNTDRSIIQAEIQNNKDEIYYNLLNENIKVPSTYKPNDYSHYVQIGEPGQKVLNAMESRRINDPAIDLNRGTREHQGTYTQGMSKLKNGGEFMLNYILNNKI